MRRALIAALLAIGSLAVPPGAGAQPAPYHEIVDTVRDLAAARMGRKPTEINTVQSLFAQGLSEQGLMDLVVDIQMEFNVVIPESEIQHGKWNDPVRGFSVRRLADLVAAQQQQRP
jgi:acyl carrier protein